MFEVDVDDLGIDEGKDDGQNRVEDGRLSGRNFHCEDDALISFPKRRGCPCRCWNWCIQVDVEDDVDAVVHDDLPDVHWQIVIQDRDSSAQ